MILSNLLTVFRNTDIQMSWCGNSCQQKVRRVNSIWGYISVLWRPGRHRYCHHLYWLALCGTVRYRFFYRSRETHYAPCHARGAVTTPSLVGSGSVFVPTSWSSYCGGTCGMLFLSKYLRDYNYCKRCNIVLLYIPQVFLYFGISFKHMNYLNPKKKTGSLHIW